MGQVTFKMVAAGDGSPPTSSGYCFFLMAHAVATVLLLITLVAAVWQFMDWVVTPSCPEASSVSSATSVTSPPVASGTTKAEEALNSPVSSGLPQHVDGAARVVPQRGAQRGAGRHR